MPLELSKSDWFTLALSSLGAIWLAVILSGLFSMLFYWIYAKIKKIDIPDTIPEMWPEL